MFHSNQILDITCEKDDLADVIDFAVKRYTENAHLFNRLDGRVRPAVAEPMPGVWAVGTGSMEPYKSGPNKGYGHAAGRGWQDMPFDYDPEIIARIAAQWLEKNPPDPGARPDIDGSVRPGFRAMSVHAARAAGLLPWPHELPAWNDTDAILVLVPFWLEYHK